MKKPKTDVKKAKINSALTGPGLLNEADMDRATGGDGNVTTLLCTSPLNPPTGPTTVTGGNKARHG